ncbi:hypothetical protein CN233_32625 [Sinorhizobium meliloti]|nr:hypothetical protein CN233_32625 [Sinorhizobium meliloti]
MRVRSRSCPSSGLPATFPASRAKETRGGPACPFSPLNAGESHLANKRLFCCGKSILGVLR